MEMFALGFKARMHLLISMLNLTSTINSLNQPRSLTPVDFLTVNMADDPLPTFFIKQILEVAVRRFCHWKQKLTKNTLALTSFHGNGYC